MNWSVLLQLLSLAAEGWGLESTKFSVSNNRVIDEYGRECFFHGLNLIYKSPPYLPETNTFDANLSYSVEDVKLLNSLGQNVMRVGVMWPGVEPVRGEYNTTYINNVIKLINMSYEYNISTLVDNHQDALSEALCGEGIPLWATMPDEWNFPEPLAAAYNTSNNHVPSNSDCLSMDWFSYCQSYASSSSYQNLYNNKDNIATSFAEHWGILAKSLKNINGIIGFELINEPWPGDVYNNTNLYNPGVADLVNLQPFYDLISPYIRGNDSDRIIFFESANYYQGSTPSVGFTHTPGGLEYASKSVLSFHFYEPADIEDSYFNERYTKAISLNTTSFLTEFTIAPDAAFTDMATTMDYADKYLQSWIGWEYKPLAGALKDGTCTGCDLGLFNKDGTINQMVSKCISRTYVQRVAGITKQVYFDWGSQSADTSGNFKLIYSIDTSIDTTQPTIIYLNRRYWYPNGFNLTINVSSDIVSYQIKNETIELYNTDDSSHNGETVLVSIIGNNGKTLKYLNYQACQTNDVSQEFSYDETTMRLKLLNESLCVFSTGFSNPVGLKECNDDDISQEWVYNKGLFESNVFETCLDVYMQAGPNIDEWLCKNVSASDAGNQLWTINGNQIVSQLNTNNCLGTVDVSK